MPKVEHIANQTTHKIRQRLCHGTTSNPAEYLVFHCDTGKGFALVKWNGGTYYNRGPNYVSPSVYFIPLKRFAEDCHEKIQVWNCAKSKDGTLTHKKALGLITAVDYPYHHSFYITKAGISFDPKFTLPHFCTELRNIYYFIWLS